MRLSVTKSITGTLSFCLHHAVGFFLLGLLVNLPSFLHSLLIIGGTFSAAEARPWWEENMALTAIEALIGGFVIAVMARALMHDRRGEDWSILPSLGEAFKRLPRVCGVALVFALITDGGLLLAEFLERLSVLVSLAAVVFVVWCAVICCVAVPVAALDDGDTLGGISYSLERSAELTKGSRWRLLAVFVLPALPFLAVVVAAVFAMGGKVAVEEIDPLWSLLAGAVFNAYFLALPVVVHEALVTLQEGPGARDTAEVFD